MIGMLAIHSPVIDLIVGRLVLGPPRHEREGGRAIIVDNTMYAVTTSQDMAASS